MSKFTFDKTKLGQYDEIKTSDGSSTLYSHAFSEACHSTSGARAETIYNFIEGCDLLKRSVSSDGHNIFEVGFGLGMGVHETLRFFERNSLKIKGQFVSMEIDPYLVSQTPLKKEPWPSSYPSINELEAVERDGLRYLYSEKNGFELIILLGDGRETVPKAAKLGLIKPIHSIYQDAFSPKKNPSLWTHQWFSLLNSLSCENDCILSTYSASVSIRKALAHAGFKLHNRAGFGNKRSATLAYNYGETAADIGLILGQSKIEPLGDPEV